MGTHRTICCFYTGTVIALGAALLASEAASCRCFPDDYQLLDEPKMPTGYQSTGLSQPSAGSDDNLPRQIRAQMPPASRGGNCPFDSSPTLHFLNATVKLHPRRFSWSQLKDGEMYWCSHHACFWRCPDHGYRPAAFVDDKAQSFSLLAAFPFSPSMVLPPAVTLPPGLTRWEKRRRRTHQRGPRRGTGLPRLLL